MTKKLIVYNGEVVETQDCKRWIYDSKNEEWVDVSSIRGNFVKIR